ncbi:CapA family protein [Bordetella trematum]|uniref:CapA family protein n=1 Tax=Bordetella trematum TaxID=123899 RepID=UPI000D8088DC|nr:CapA family protein [Bordetella trematum]SPU51413.1 Bacterial capsule synthesis protein PGA_cap [Bordetella trematum]VDH08667.1 Bacterial capsule synthesis protein PGA_cap [Bordetella trematum]
MQQTFYLLGDINFRGVEQAEGLFEHVGEPLRDADMVFANLECCLYDLPDSARERRGFYVHPAMGDALLQAGVQLVGCANNVNIGHEAIGSSLAALDRLGIPHVGAGLSDSLARAPQVLERAGVRYGFLQRTAVFWPDGHEATDEHAGVAVIRGHTAYRPAFEQQAARTRPGVPPQVLTWADPDSLERFREEVAQLREQADVVVASLHWGYRREVLNYQREYAHAAVQAGADIVFGHGPHMILPIEVYRGKPIFYGGGNFSFQMAHHGDAHTDWVGMTACVRVEDGKVGDIELSFTQRNEANQTLRCPVREFPLERDLLLSASRALGASLRDEGDILVLPRQAA